MDEIKVYISGEDAVTKAIIERLLRFCSPRFQVTKEIPARGSEIKKKISALNTLAQTQPVVMLTDLDTTDCAPILKTSLLKGEPQSQNFLINIAIDESEAWLMADRNGFAKFLDVEEDTIPKACLQKMGGLKRIMEMSFHAKSSWVLTHEIAPQSRNEELKHQICAQGTASKGPEYNDGILPFVKTFWNIEEAMKNSDSLSRMVKRLKSLAERMG